MTPHRRIPTALSLLLTAAALAGCGTVSADEAEHADELLDRAAKWHVSPDLVFVTDAEGYALAVQSAGVYGDDAFRSVYVAADRGGRQFTLTADHGTLGRENCAFVPLSGVARSNDLHCTQDGDLWYRTDGTAHEYAKVVGSRLVQVTAQRDAVDRDVLRAAAQHAHVVEAPADKASGTDQPASPTPFERGDLPPHGDGAPLDPPPIGG